jgi:predicted aspartyl protease
MILDTGADRTLVRPSALSKLGVSIESATRIVIKGVTGTSHADAVWVNSVEVGEARVGPLLIIAHEADLKGAEGLLGRDFLATFTVTIDPKEQIVTLTPN